jgi:hypothetical protein
LPPLSCSTSPVPVRPETMPPMVKVVGGGGAVYDVPQLSSIHGNNARIAIRSKDNLKEGFI